MVQHKIDRRRKTFRKPSQRHGEAFRIVVLDIAAFNTVRTEDARCNHFRIQILQLDVNIMLGIDEIQRRFFQQHAVELYFHIVQIKLLFFRNRRLPV